MWSRARGRAPRVGVEGRHRRLDHDFGWAKNAIGSAKRPTWASDRPLRAAHRLSTARRSKSSEPITELDSTTFTFTQQGLAINEQVFYEYKTEAHRQKKNCAPHGARPDRSRDGRTGTHTRRRNSPPAERRPPRPGRVLRVRLLPKYVVTRVRSDGTRAKAGSKHARIRCRRHVLSKLTSPSR